MTAKTICIHQFSRPQYSFKREGVGDCTTCEPDYMNRFCLDYFPVKVYTLEGVKRDE